MTDRHLMKTHIARSGRAVFVILTLLAALSGEAFAQSFVAGSGNTNGFTIAGRLRVTPDNRVTGQFTIVVHRNVPEGTTAAAVCNYRQFDTVVIGKKLATFHSVGVCQVFTTSGGRYQFESDNTFAIVDNGEPGPGVDAVDVNMIGASGVTIPGSYLLHGNFIVHP